MWMLLFRYFVGGWFKNDKTTTKISSETEKGNKLIKIKQIDTNLLCK